MVLRTAVCEQRAPLAPIMRRGRPLTSQTAFGGQLPYEGSLGRSAANNWTYIKRSNVAWFCELRPATGDLRPANGELRSATGAPYKGRYELRAPSAPIIDVTRSCRYNEE